MPFIHYILRYDLIVYWGIEKGMMPPFYWGLQKTKEVISRIKIIRNLTLKLK